MAASALLPTHPRLPKYCPVFWFICMLVGLLGSAVTFSALLLHDGSLRGHDQHLENQRDSCWWSLRACRKSPPSSGHRNVLRTAKTNANIGHFSTLFSAAMIKNRNERVSSLFVQSAWNSPRPDYSENLLSQVKYFPPSLSRNILLCFLSSIGSKKSLLFNHCRHKSNFQNGGIACSVSMPGNKSNTTIAPSLQSLLFPYTFLHTSVDSVVSKTFNASAIEPLLMHWWNTSGLFIPEKSHLLWKKQRQQLGRPFHSETKTFLQCNLTEAENTEEDGLPYYLPMPPPNITGDLHYGHALLLSIQDLLIRFHRMCGYRALLIPGTDHAGIAAFLAFKKDLEKNITCSKTFLLTLEQFRDTFEQWTERKKKRIYQQMQRLGISADWSRTTFTMDTDVAFAVADAFISLYKKELIYRGDYIVNWVPSLQCAISDQEVNLRNETVPLYFFKYVLDAPPSSPLLMEAMGNPTVVQEFIPVATTRPETLLGDVALCVHPADTRYQHLIGKNVTIPFLKKMTPIPIISDTSVDPSFGTGVVKITPGHSAIDFDLLKRLKLSLPVKVIFDKEGKIRADLGIEPYAGLTIIDCRKTLWKELEVNGLAIHIHPHITRIPRYEKTGEVVEPTLSRQWFLRTKQMALKAKEAIETGQISLQPKHFKTVWKDWIDATHDWCISRQLPWGHPIPIWYMYRVSPEEILKQKKRVKGWNGLETNNARIFHSNEMDLGTDAANIIPTSSILKNHVQTSTSDEIASKDFNVSVISATEWCKELQSPQDRNHHSEKCTGVFFAEQFENIQISEKERVAVIAADGAEQAYKEALTFLKTWHEQKSRNVDFCSKDSIECYRDLKTMASAPTIPSNLTDSMYLLKRDSDVLDTWFSSCLWPATALFRNFSLAMETITSPEKRNSFSYWETVSNSLKMPPKGMIPSSHGSPSAEFVKAIPNYFPAALLTTGYDILCCWVIRMTMLTLELTDHVPFKAIYLHGLVRDCRGNKLSKTKGNTEMNLLQVCERYGSDALRFSLIKHVDAAKDVRINEETLRKSSQLIHKLWNVGRYLWRNLHHLEGIKHAETPPAPLFADFATPVDMKSASLIERYFVSLVHEIGSKVTESIQSFDFISASRLLESFLWNELAPWYIGYCSGKLQSVAEISPRNRLDALNNATLPHICDKEDSDHSSSNTALMHEEGLSAAAVATQFNNLQRCLQVFVYIWKSYLQLLHPFIPFVTETLYQLLPVSLKKDDPPSLMVSRWPFHAGVQLCCIK
ncbi:valyl-tRna synthetase [Cardiosporidium cionae]|uniref:valine--tRNA ligase n=1 Tax=Cardiosporidium cionae TaxID=476202 RepID=A0ABQ7JDP4_9APIC|nr:valyl-tRna synthetase [Cardiosporidium cionae]|eukprot:KAF8822147.1 valyl-tRna synthetase [Cardiosporidium cionae]